MKGFAAFDAGATPAAVNFSALVAGPGAGEVDAQFVAAGGDVFLAHGNEGAHQFEIDVGALLDGVGHGLHEFLPAVGVDGVVSRVGGDDEAVGFTAFSEAGSDGEHDAIAEGNHGGFHVGFLVVAFRDVAPGLEEVGFEEVVDEVEFDGLVRDAELLTVPGCKGDFAVVVFRPVVEGNSGGDFVLPGGVVEGGDGVHAAADQDHYPFSLLHTRTLKTWERGVERGRRHQEFCEYLASAVRLIPPRWAKMPRTVMRRGLVASTRSSRMRVTTCSLKAGKLRKEAR